VLRHCRLYTEAKSLQISSAVFESVKRSRAVLYTQEPHLFSSPMFCFTHCSFICPSIWWTVLLLTTFSIGRIHICIQVSKDVIPDVSKHMPKVAQPTGTTFTVEALFRITLCKGWLVWGRGRRHKKTTACIVQGGFKPCMVSPQAVSSQTFKPQMLCTLYAQSGNFLSIFSYLIKLLDFWAPLNFLFQFSMPHVR
jgi:hypothetical protein